jgi:hypothetical protein
MLERAALWLSAPSDAWPLPGGPAGGRVRLLLDADSRELVGHAALYPRGWWPWRRGRRFAAFEAPDASLVFTGRAAGWPEWTTTVTDADGHPVALVRGAYVLTPGGEFLAYRQPRAGGRGGAFLGADGHAIAHWEAEGVGTRLRFGPELQDDPFTKMGILAAVIAA